MVTTQVGIVCTGPTRSTRTALQLMRKQATPSIGQAQQCRISRQGIDTEAQANTTSRKITQSKTLGGISKFK